MFKYALFGLLFFPLSICFAQEKSYTEISKSLLDTEFLRSPVYTKRLYRDTREKDTVQYEQELVRLKELKDKKKITTKEYNTKKTMLEKAYQQAYGKENLMQQGANISKDPVNSFYNEVMNTQDRTELKHLSDSELVQKMKYGYGIESSSTVQSANRPQTPVFTKAPAPVGSRGMAPAQSRVRVPASVLDSQKKSAAIPQKKKKLGEKSIPVNLSTFK